jgi:hypothetical protein
MDTGLLWKPGNTFSLLSGRWPRPPFSTGRQASHLEAPASAGVVCMERADGKGLCGLVEVLIVLCPAFTQRFLLEVNNPLAISRVSCHFWSDMLTKVIIVLCFYICFYF